MPSCLLKNKNKNKFLSHSSGSWEVQRKESADLVSGEDSFLVDGVFLLHPQKMKGARDLSGVFI